MVRRAKPWPDLPKSSKPHRYTFRGYRKPGEVLPDRELPKPKRPSRLVLWAYEAWNRVVAHWEAFGVIALVLLFTAGVTYRGLSEPSCEERGGMRRITGYATNCVNVGTDPPIPVCTTSPVYTCFLVAKKGMVP